MKRIGLLGMIAALAAVLAAAVVYGSAYAPVIEPAKENIEEMWAIEDARQESERPLVTALENNGVPLGYDAASNTFYYTLGLGSKEEWPEIHLTAPGADGVKMVFYDDYTYDWCEDAVREGYSYEVLAYNDTEYSYFYVVFTGLMQVSLTSQEPLDKEDKPARVSVHTSVGALESNARVHHRGGITSYFAKHPYRVEFTRTGDGRNKIYQNVPELGTMNQFVLIPMWYDHALMRDRLSWEIYGELAGEDRPYGARRLSYAEVFVNDCYEGVYLLLEPYDHRAEISKAGVEHAAADTVYCTAPIYEVLDRPTLQGSYTEGRGFALHYPPVKEDPFDDIRDYMEICQTEDDAAFAARVMEQIDLDSLLGYHLFMQGIGLADNVYNNQFIWAAHEDGTTRYRFIPWDMDMTWAEDMHIEWVLDDYSGWLYFPIVDRLLNVNPDNIRARWAQMWKDMRKSVLTTENVEAKLAQYMAELNDTGAAARNAERWSTSSYNVESIELTSFAEVRFELMDRAVEYIASTEGRIPMLTYEAFGNEDGVANEAGEIYGF